MDSPSIFDHPAITGIVASAGYAVFVLLMRWMYMRPDRFAKLQWLPGKPWALQLLRIYSFTSIALANLVFVLVAAASLNLRPTLLVVIPLALLAGLATYLLIPKNVSSYEDLLVKREIATRR